MKTNKSEEGNTLESLEPPIPAPVKPTKTNGENRQSRVRRRSDRSGEVEATNSNSTSPEAGSGSGGGDSSGRRMSSRQRKPSWRVGFDPGELNEPKKKVVTVTSAIIPPSLTPVIQSPTTTATSEAQPYVTSPRGRGRPKKAALLPPPAPLQEETNNAMDSKNNIKEIDESITTTNNDTNTDLIIDEENINIEEPTATASTASIVELNKATESDIVAKKVGRSPGRPPKSKRKRFKIVSRANNNNTQTMSIPRKRIRVSQNNTETIILKENAEITFENLDLGHGYYKKEIPAAKPLSPPVPVINEKIEEKSEENSIRMEVENIDNDNIENDNLNEEANGDENEDTFNINSPVIATSSSTNTNRRRNSQIKREEEFTLKQDFQPCECSKGFFNGQEIRIDRKSLQNNNNEDNPIFCQAIDQIGEKKIGCCRTIETNSDDSIQLYRVSARCQFKLYCSYHLSRLRLHHCCSLCGCFCLSQDNGIMLCRTNDDTKENSEGKLNSHHLFHISCALDEVKMLTKRSDISAEDHIELISKIHCPHCGENKDLKEIKLFFNSEKSILINERESYKKQMFDDILMPIKADTEDFILGYIEESTSKEIEIAHLEANKLKTENVSEEFFINALEKGDLISTTVALLADVDVNKPFENKNGQLPLHLACVSYSMPIVHSLVKSGAQINEAGNTRNNLTPLMLAACLNHPLLVRYFISSGGDRLMKGPNGMNILHLACKEGSTETVKKLLECYHSDMMDLEDADDLTPFLISLKYGKENCAIEILKCITANYDEEKMINRPDKGGNLPLHLAAKNGLVQVISKIWELGKNTDVNYQNKRGETPMHLAIMNGQDGSVLKLLLKKSDLTSIKDCNGRSCYDVALKMNNCIRISTEDQEKIEKYKAIFNMIDQTLELRGGHKENVVSNNISKIMS